MVPIIGPIIGAVPPILLGLLQGSSVMIQVIYFSMWFVQQLDFSFYYAETYGIVIEVHPVAIIAGVLIGGSLKGNIGDDDSRPCGGSSSNIITPYVVLR